MIVFFNTLGVGMIVGCVALGYGLTALIWAVGFNVGHDLVPVLAGPLMVVWDLVYRRQRASEFKDWWKHPDLGGHFSYIPIWVIGVFCALLGGGAFLS